MTALEWVGTIVLCLLIGMTPGLLLMWQSHRETKRFLRDLERQWPGSQDPRDLQ